MLGLKFSEGFAMFMQCNDVRRLMVAISLPAIASLSLTCASDAAGDPAPIQWRDRSIPDHANGGISDLYGKAKTTLPAIGGIGGIKLFGAYHEFSDDDGSADYGRE